MQIALLDSCRGCGESLKPNQWKLEMEPIPLVGKLFSEKVVALQQNTIPITWICCGSCSLLQVVEDVDDTEIYDVYNYSSSSFKGLQDHFESFARVIDQELLGKPDAKFLEIGCNDGILIKKITKAQAKVGIDPSDIAEKSCDGSYSLINEYFSSEMKSQLPSASVDVISTSNSFAHFTNIMGAIKEIKRLLKPNGSVFVEVHDGDLLLKELQWDTIYHEHKVEWTESAIEKCFASFGMALSKVTKLPMHGGTIRLKFKKSNKEINSCPVTDLGLDENLKKFEDDFKNRFKHELYEKLKDIKEFCCYGASGRAVNWLYQMGFEEKVVCIYDDSSERVGKYIGHCGIEIRDGDLVGERSLPVVITAWNFSDNIRNKHANKNIEWLQYY